MSALSGMVSVAFATLGPYSLLTATVPFATLALAW